MDRLIEWFNQLVRKAVAPLPYAGIYPYSVVSCNKALQTLDARSLTRTMPDLTGVPMVSPGLLLDVPFGTQVLIGFRGMDPTSPYVAGYGQSAASRVVNEVQLGWLGLSQLAGTPFTVTAVYVPGNTLVPPTPEVPAETPAPLTPVPAYFKIIGGKVTGNPLVP